MTSNLEPAFRIWQLAPLMLALLAPPALIAQTTSETQDPEDTLDVMPTGPSAAPDGALIAEPVPEFKVDRFEAAQLYDFYIDNDDWEQALEVADIELTLSEVEFGTDDMGIVPALTNVGNALLANRRAAEAIEVFDRAVAIVEIEGGIFNEHLYAPLLGLGRSHQALGNHDQARTALVRAQHVTHRNEGVYNLTQINAIRTLVDSMMMQDKWEEAENLMLARYRIQRTALGEDSLDSLPAIFDLARWYHSVRDLRQARQLYKLAIEEVEQQRGAHDRMLIPALKGLASSYLEERDSSLDKGLDAHNRIVQIVDSDPNVSLETRVMSHLELGDWYIRFNREDQAWDAYRRAWELALEETESGREWEPYFNRPHLIHAGPALSIDVLGHRNVGEEVYYDFEFTIDRDGRPKRINVIGSNLHGQTRSSAMTVFRLARFRPSIIDGEATATPGYKVRRIFPTPAPDGFGELKVGVSASPIGR